MIKKYKKIFAAILVSLLWFSFSLAEDQLPDVMVGQTTVTAQSAMGSLSLPNTSAYMQAGSISSPTLGSSDFTVMAWIKPDNTNDDQTIFGCGRDVHDNGTSSSTVGWAFGLHRVDATTLYLKVSIHNAGGYSNVSSSNYTIDGKWHHVAFTFKPSTGAYVFAYDGHADVAHTTVIGSVYNASNSLLYIGSKWVPYSMPGFIDEARIYGAALSSSDLISSGSLANAESTSFTAATLLARWSFASNATDVSGNGHNGTLKNGAGYGADISSVATTFYGGYTGNEVVYNYNASGKIAGTSLSPSIMFDGINDYINIADQSNLAFSRGTFSAWVKPSRSGTTCETLFAMGSTDTLTISIGDGCTNTFSNELITAVRNYSGNVTEGAVLQSDASVRASSLFNAQWHYIAVGIWSGNVVIYLDGVRQTISSGTNFPITGFSNNATYDYAAIGAKLNPGTPPVTPNTLYKGGMDDVRIYNSVLLAADVAKIYQNTFTDVTYLKAHWTLDEATGTTAADSSSGGSHDGTLKYFVSPPIATSSWSDDGPLIADASQTDLFGFDNNALTYCVTNILLGSLKPYDSCFKANSSTASSLKVVSSRTSVNGSPILETAALIYPPKTVMGDVYGVDMSNFAFWGRNLNQSGSGTTPSGDASWKEAGIINNQAQASWKSDEFAAYKDKLSAMAGEGTDIPSSGVLSGTLILDSNNGNSINTDPTLPATRKQKYPQGRIWVIDCRAGTNALCALATKKVTISSDVSFVGKGTLIILGGDLQIDPGIDITADTTADPDSRLGFVVISDTGNTKGNITLSGNNIVKAAMIDIGDGTTTGKFNIAGNNVEMTGSFVAKTFSFGAYNNIRFYYDYGLDSVWPPGFRDLKMPVATR